MNTNPYEPPKGGTHDGAPPTNSARTGWEFTMKRLLCWGAGFIALFLINVLIELLILPQWGLNNTPKNDIYFRSWWFVVGLWFLFGNAILAAFERTIDGHRFNK